MINKSQISPTDTSTYLRVDLRILTDKTQIVFLTPVVQDIPRYLSKTYIAIGINAASAFTRVDAVLVHTGLVASAFAAI